MAAATFLFAGKTFARDESPTVNYSPTTANVEGDQPLVHSYALSITSPASLSAPVTIVPEVAVVTAPASVSPATALSFVSLSTSATAPLVFSTSGETRTVTVTVAIPDGTAAGDYSWSISSPGWPSGTFDGRARINAKVTIAGQISAPAVTIKAPVDGTNYTLVADGAALEIPLEYLAIASSEAPITSVSARLAGTPVENLIVDGIGTNAAVTSGMLKISAPGVYTVETGATNDAGTSLNTVEITVYAASVPLPVAPSCGVTWLPPISMGKVQQGGSILPIKFMLNCPGNSALADSSIVVAIHEVLSDGRSTEPTLYPYGTASPTSPDYTINAAGMYHLNFATDRGERRYHIDVIRRAPGTDRVEVLGTKEFTTK